MNYFRIGAGVVVTSLIAGLLYLIVWLLFCSAHIGVGHVGMVFNRSEGLQKELLEPGWHMVGWLDKVTELTVSTETQKYVDDDAFRISTKDGKTVTAELMYSYHFDRKEMPTIFEKFRGRSQSSIVDNYMKDRLTAVTQSITSQYGVLEVYGDKRGSLNDKVFTSFRDDLRKVGIVVETFNFSKIEPDKESLKAIQSLVDSQLKLNQLKVEKEQAVVAAEKRDIDSKAEADANYNLKVKEADAILYQAQKQAEANRVLAESITTELIKYKQLEKWNGEPTMVVGSGDAGLMFQMPQK